MEVSDNILSLVDQFDDNLDDLEDALKPLLSSAMSETASKLPLLDRAKLYVLATYSIESVLFSLLRLNGTNAKEHPVFQELTRVRQYFDKIKNAETGEQWPNLRVDRAAAGRIIKHALAQKQPSEDGQSKQAVQSVVSLEGVQVAPNKRKFDQLEGVKPSSTAPQVSEARSEYDSTDSSEESSGSMEAEPPTNEATSGFFGENQPPITVMGGVPDTGNPVGELNKNGEGKSGRRGKKQNKKKSQGNALKDTSQLTRKQKKKKRAKAAAKRQKKMLQQGP